MADTTLEIILAAKDVSGKAFDSLKYRLTNLSKAVFSFHGALGGILGVGGLGALVTKSLDTADSIAKTADKVGLATSELQELRHAADLAGVSTGTMDMAMQRFSRRLGEAAQGKGELVGVLQKYNIAVVDSNGKTRRNVDVLDDLSEAIKGAGSEQEQLRIAFKAFDSEGAALVNMLRGGKDAMAKMRDEARDLGLVLDEQILRNAERAKDEISKLTRVIQTRFTEAVVKNADQIARLADQLIRVIEAVGELSRLRSVTGTLFEGGELAKQGLIDIDKFLKSSFKERQRMVDQARDMLGADIDPHEAARLGLSSRMSRGQAQMLAGIKPPKTPAAGSVSEVKKAKADLKDLTDFWRAQADERYDVMSRSYQAEIDLHQQLVDDIMEQDNSYTDFWQRQFDERDDVMSRSFESMKEGLGELELMIGGWAKSSSDAIADFVVDGKASFSDLVKSMIKDMISLVVYQKIMGPLFSGLSGAIGGAGIGFGGARAAGGPVYGGQTYLVGERGPELLHVGSSGYVNPNAAAGDVVINIKNYSGQPVQKSQQQDPGGRRRVEIMIGSAIASGGPAAKAVEQRYGLTPVGRYR